ncbi:hypothetical protein Tco_0957265 [Tanacetum coccineum]
MVNEMQQWLVREEDDIDATIYGINSFSVYTVDDIVKELEYSATGVSYYHFMIPTTNLDYGLVALGSDHDVKELLKYVSRNKLIELYIEHDTNTLDTYSNGHRDEVITDELDDNMPPSPTINKANLDVTGLDSFGSDLKYGVDIERRKKLRELRKQGKSTDKGMFQYVFFFGRMLDNKELVKNMIRKHLLESRRKIDIIKNDNERVREKCVGTMPTYSTFDLDVEFSQPTTV